MLEEEGKGIMESIVDKYEVRISSEYGVRTILVRSRSNTLFKYGQKYGFYNIYNLMENMYF